MAEANDDIVEAFLREALAELWAGRIEVTYEPGMEWPCSEPEAHIFFHRGVIFQVVNAHSNRRWLQVAGEHIRLAGKVELFADAVRAPECKTVPVEKQRVEVIEAIRAATTDFIGEHAAGRWNQAAARIQQVVGGA